MGPVLSILDQTCEGTTMTPGETHHFIGTGGELLVAQIRAAGVRYIFTNPGSLEAGFFDALVDAPELPVIMGLHEGIVIAMADGYAKATGDVAFVNVHTIAGTAQMAGQMYNIARDGSAVVITAGLRDNERFNDYVSLGPLPGFDQKDINRQFVKMAWEVRDPRGIPVIIRRAFKVATTRPVGATYVAVADHALETPDVEADILPRPQFTIQSTAYPDPVLVDRMATAMLDAARPVLFLGDEVWQCGAQIEVIELAERWGIPVTVGRQAHQNVPSQHPLYIGRYDRVTHVPAGDLLLSVGARDVGYGRPDDLAFPREGRQMAIGLDPSMMGRVSGLDLAIVADVKVTLRALLEALDGRATPERRTQLRDARIGPILAYATQARQAYEQTIQEHFNDQPIHPTRLGYEMEYGLDPETIVVSENFTGQHEMLTLGHRPGEKRWISTGAGSLGLGVGAAIGAKLGVPDRPVALSIGDGATMYSASGFWTMARYGVPVLTIVWNNQNYQVVREAFHRYGRRMASTGQYPGMFLGDPDIDFVGLARAQGVPGERVTDRNALASAIARGRDAIRAGEPYLIDVVISRMGGGAESTWHQGFRLR